MQRKPLIPLYKAITLYGKDKVVFKRPRYVPKGVCEWCGSLITNKRRTSCCCKECSQKFQIATSPVMYANQGSAGGYRNHIFRRDDYTCQKCGAIHRVINEYGIPLPTTDGKLDLHHILPVARGGTNNPDNLVTWCRDCHKRWHAENGIDY